MNDSNGNKVIDNGLVGEKSLQVNGVSRSMVARMKAKAAIDGMSLKEWILRQLDRALDGEPQDVLTYDTDGLQSSRLKPAPGGSEPILADVLAPGESAELRKASKVGRKGKPHQAGRNCPKCERPLVKWSPELDRCVDCGVNYPRENN